jgi:hypothetical protein
MGSFFGRVLACWCAFAMVAAMLGASCSSGPSIASVDTPGMKADAMADAPAPDAGVDASQEESSSGDASETDVGCEGDSCDAGCQDACPVMCGDLTKCGDACVDVTSDPAHCGSCDTVCDAGKLCEDRKCVPDCGDSTRCGDVCVDLRTNVDHCGECSKPCPRPTGDGKAVCRANKCAVTCDDGEPPCGETCCKGPSPNHVMTCQDDKTCVARCLGITATCSDGTATCASWDFESGTTEGLNLDAIDSCWDGFTFLSTLQRQATGLRSLAVGVDTSHGSALLTLPIHFCAKGAPLDTTVLLGMHARIRIEPAQGYPAFDPYTVGVYYTFYDGLDNYVGEADYHHPESSVWMSIDDTFLYNTYPPHKVTDILFHVVLGTFDWKGTVYFDDIRIY